MFEGILTFIIIHVDSIFRVDPIKLSQIETTVKSSKPSVKKETTPPPTPPPVSPPPIPPPPPAEITSPVVLPPVPPLPEPCQQEQPPGWADLATPEPWVAPPSFPGGENVRNDIFIGISYNVQHVKYGLNHFTLSN